jgi:hypothetical protein
MGRQPEEQCWTGAWSLGWSPASKLGAVGGALSWRSLGGWLSFPGLRSNDLERCLTAMGMDASVPQTQLELLEPQRSGF